MGYRLPGTEEEEPAHVGTQTRKKVRRRRRVRKTIAVLPTLFTLGNALCGFGAIFFASRDPDLSLPFHWTPLTFAAVFIFLGMVLDGLDGRIARMTRSMSDLGEQLDSMSDMVTFGVAPAFMAVQLAGVQAPLFGEAAIDDGWFDRVALVVALIYVACTALRLARFNVDLDNDEHTDKRFFKGLPSPGAAGTVASLVLLHQHALARLPETHWAVGLAAVAMTGITLLTAFAMVSRLKYVHVFNRYMRGRAPFMAVARGVIVGLVLVVILPQAALAVGFAGYALSAPVASGMRKIRARSWRG